MFNSDNLYGSSFAINDLASGSSCQIFDSGSSLFGGMDICAGSGADYLSSTSLRLEEGVLMMDAEAWRIAQEEDDLMFASYLLG